MLEEGLELSPTLLFPSHLLQRICLYLWFWAGLSQVWLLRSLLPVFSRGKEIFHWKVFSCPLPQSLNTGVGRTNCLKVAQKVPAGCRS